MRNYVFLNKKNLAIGSIILIVFTTFMIISYFKLSYDTYNLDSVDFHFWNYHWYTFNIADSAIVLGVFLILLTQKPWQPDKNFK